MAEIAVGMDARPADGMLETGGVDREAERSEEGVLGRFHELEEVREVGDAGHVVSENSTWRTSLNS